LKTLGVSFFCGQAKTEAFKTFSRFSMDGRRKRIKKYAFLNENELIMWEGENRNENKTKRPVVSKIFLLCFRCDETSTVLFRFSPSEAVFKANL